MNETIKTIKSRRSVRNYSPDQISREHLDQIIEAGILAPSAVNEQPWHFTVIQNQDLLQRINDTVRNQLANSDIEWMRNNGRNPNFMVTYNAPTLIVVSGNTKALAWEADCSFAMENMMLAAESFGIGSVCLGLVNFFLGMPGEAEKLRIPEGYKPFYAIAFGHRPNNGTIETPERNRNVVNYIR